MQNSLLSKKASAAFEKAGDSRPTTLQVSANDGTSLLNQQLPKQDIESAVDKRRQLPCHDRPEQPRLFTVAQYVTVFSVADREVRLIDDSEGRRPCINNEIWCQGPDTVILVGHTFPHHIAAPDDPILLKYQMSDFGRS